MRISHLGSLAGLVVMGVVLGRVEAPHNCKAAEAGELAIAHNVYFSLTDNSAANKKKLVDACKKHLSKLPGIVFFAAETLAEEFNRPIHDRDFDVGLHIVFKDKESYDKYESCPAHKQFVEENKANWKKVRVFDSRVEQ